MKDTTSIIYGSTRRHIRSSQKHLTILFTDIEGSTKYWDTFGDVQGRLMVDRHNRLLFPVVRRFRGKIIKTIGDSIMAAFTKPEYALKAAVAMQQTMAIERQGDDTFDIHIRIGIHTGDAIVEKEDVFGDSVNVAARIEKIGKGDEILVSQTTVAYIDDEYAFIFNRKGWFVPRGKQKKLHVYTCDWKNHPKLIDEILNTRSLPVSRRQKIELGFYFAVTVAVLYFIYDKYVRYLISDSEEVALLYLNFSTILANHPYMAAGAAVLGLIILVIFIRMQMLPLTILRLVKGGFVFAVGFMVIYFSVRFLPVNYEKRWNEILDTSQHFYVEVLENNSSVLQEPSLKAEEIEQMSAGQLLLQTDFKQIGGLAWNKVQLGAERYGWIVNVSPPKMGVPEKHISQSYKFHFRYKDLYAFILAFLCFIIGFWKFRVRPI